MTELLNTKASHDCGFTFNGGPRGVSLGSDRCDRSSYRQVRHLRFLRAEAAERLIMMDILKLRKSSNAPPPDKQPPLLIWKLGGGCFGSNGCNGGHGQG